MIDRGFIKWRPFSSLSPSKDTFRAIDEKKRCAKPVLFPEEISVLNDLLIDAYYSKDIIVITYYEAGKIKKIISTIKKINPSSKTIELGCGKKISFGQIIHLELSENT